MSDNQSPIDLRSLLRTPVDQIERPKSLPNGHYTGEILNYETGLSRQKQTPYIRILIRPEGPCEDVTDDTTGINFSRMELRTDFFITPRSLYIFNDFLDHVLGENTKKLLAEERVDDIRGARIRFKASRRMNDDGTDSGFNDVDNRTIIAA